MPKKQPGLMHALEEFTAAAKATNHCPPCCADLALPQPPDSLKGWRTCQRCFVEWRL